MQVAEQYRDVFKRMLDGRLDEIARQTVPVELLTTQSEDSRQELLFSNIYSDQSPQRYGFLRFASGKHDPTRAGRTLLSAKS